MSRSIQQAAAVCLVIGLTGCATMHMKFTAGTQADIGYFTDSTLSMMRDANFGFTRGGAVYVKEFVDLNGAEEQDYLKRTGGVDRGLKAIIQYSLRLVTITELTSDERQQIKQYADALAKMDPDVVSALGMDRAQYDEIIMKIFHADNLLSALREAQPIMNALGRYMDQTLDKVNEATGALSKKLSKRIDTQYSDIIRYQQALDREKGDTLRALSQVYGTIRGDKTAYKALMKSGQIRDARLIPEGKPTYAQLMRMGEYLIKKFDIQHAIAQEVEPDWNRYKATVSELSALEKQVNDEVKKFRLISLTWVRAHQKMSSGKAKAAEWFDISDAPGLLIKLGSKAVIP